MEQSDEVRYPLLAQQIVRIMLFMSDIDSILHPGLVLFTVSGDWDRQDSIAKACSFNRERRRDLHNFLMREHAEAGEVIECWFAAKNHGMPC
jgi:hypothetical protein